MGLEANSQNFLLMHAMGPNVAGVIGSASRRCATGFGELIDCESMLKGR